MNRETIIQIAREAGFDLPTADHLPDAGEMIETAAPGGGYVRPVVLDARQALPTAAQVDDINVAESFTSVTKTAAPVGERELFERWAKDNAIRTDLGAWDAWQARAVLSAGDTVDAQRYRWLREQCNHKGTEGSRIASREYGMDWDAAIDKAMRKGQL